MRINKHDTNGVKPLLGKGELGYDDYTAGGDAGRVYVGTGSANVGLATKTEVVGKVAKVTSTDNAVVRFDGTTGEVQNSGVIIDDNNNIMVSGSNYPNITLSNINTSSTFPLIALQDLRTNAHSWNIEVGRSGNALSFRDNNAGDGVYERMRIDSAGNIGVGVTSPQSKLHSSGIITTGAIAVSDGQLNIKRASDGLTVGVVGIDDANSLMKLKTEYGEMSFQNYSGEKMRINGAGNVGIGATPSAWGAINKVIDIGNMSYSGRVDGGSTGASIAQNSYRDTSNVWRYKQSAYASRIEIGNGGYYWFTAPSGTAGNAITWTTAMTLDASGNLGIGTSSPSVKVHTYGTATGNSVTSRVENSSDTGYAVCEMKAGTGHLWQVSGSGSTASVNPSGFNIYDSGASALRFAIDSSGNVGIGTSSPSGFGKLAVKGQIAPVSPDEISQGVFAVDNTGKVTVGGYNSSGTNYLSFTAGGGNERMRIDSNGTVVINNGIELKGETKTHRINTDSNVGGTNEFRIARYTTAGVYEDIPFRINPAGNVGIGTSSGGRKLNVLGAIGLGITAETGIGWRTSDFAGSYGEISMDTSSNMRIYTGNTERLRIDSAGNIGIGTTPSAWSSSYKAIQNSAGAIVGIGTSENTYLQNSYIRADGNYAYVNSATSTRYTQANGTHYWFTAPSGTAGSAITWTTAMTLGSNGNLLIGTTTDNGVDKLHVNGTIAYKPKIEKEVTIVATLTGGEWHDTGILSTDVYDPSHEHVFNLLVYEDSWDVGNNNFTNLWLFQTCGFINPYTNAGNAPELANLSRTGHASNGGYVKLRWQYVGGGNPAKLQISVQYTTTFNNTVGKTLAIKLRRI